MAMQQKRKGGMKMKTASAIPAKKAISFKTSNGKAITFKTNVGVSKAKQTQRVKMLEKRLTMMEKMVMKQNQMVVSKGKKKGVVADVVELDKDAQTVSRRGGGGGTGVVKKKGGVVVKVDQGGSTGNGGKLVGHAGVKKV
jgi:hypothetical protein